MPPLPETPPPNPAAPPAPGRNRGRSGWRLVALAGVVLGLHGLVLQGLPVGVGEGWGGGVRPITTLRVGAAPATPAETVATAGTVTTAPAAPPEAAPEAPPTAAAPPYPPPAAASAASAPTALAEAPAAAETPASATLVATAAPADPSTEAAGTVEATSGGQPPPVYATRPPPPVQMAFDLRRGALHGDAEFGWQHDGRRYELTMTGTAFSLTLLNWRSSGAFDGAGLAPERFLDSRRSRDQRAANFQRAAGKITFSGPPVEYPLLPGAQDRLSWLVQIAAIVDAEPAAFQPGGRISFFVAGSRGEGEVWHFNVKGREDLALPMGAVRGALYLQREPRRPYDTGGEVWLDPARHHLPVRVRLTVAQTDERTEFLLRSLRGL